MNNTLDNASETTLFSLNSIVTAVNTGAVVISSSALPSGASTSALQTNANSSLTDIETNTDSLAVVGNGLSAGALRMTLSSDSTGVIGVTDNGGSLTVDGVFWQTTQPVSASSLPLPSGASTSALQTNANSSLTNIETNTDSLAVVGNGLSAGALRMTLSSDSTGVIGVTDNGGSLTVDSPELTSIDGKITACNTGACVIAGSVSTDISTVPIVGTHGNCWNSDATGVLGDSNVIDCQYVKNISIFGTSDNATTFTVFASQSNTNFYR